MNAGLPALRFKRKRGTEGVIAVHQQTAQRIGHYLDVAGHSDNFDRPLFGPVRGNGDLSRHLNPDSINRIVKKYCRQVGIDHRQYSAHSMRTTSREPLTMGLI